MKKTALALLAGAFLANSALHLQLSTLKKQEQKQISLVLHACNGRSEANKTSPVKVTLPATM